MDWKKCSKDEKSAIMRLTRTIAYRKAAEGELVVLQKGLVLKNPCHETVRGPIRLRLAASKDGKDTDESLPEKMEPESCLKADTETLNNPRIEKT